MKDRKVAAMCGGVLFVLAFVAVAQAQAPVNVTGTWTLNFVMRDQPITDIVTLRQSGSSVTGEIKVDVYNPITLEDVKLDGHNISWTLPMPASIVRNIYFKGTVDGNTMKGTVLQGKAYVLDYTATRK